jgi:hypothetical protein
MSGGAAHCEKAREAFIYKASLGKIRVENGKRQQRKSHQADLPRTWRYAKGTRRAYGLGGDHRKPMGAGNKPYSRVGGAVYERSYGIKTPRGDDRSRYKSDFHTSIFANIAYQAIFFLKPLDKITSRTIYYAKSTLKIALWTGFNDGLRLSISQKAFDLVCFTRINSSARGICAPNANFF